MTLKSPAIRISIVLTLLTANLLFVANLVGFIPDKSESLLETRKILSESLALQFSNAAEKGEFQTIQNTIRAVVNRNDDIRSAAIRTKEGQLIALAGEHLSHWVMPVGGKSTPTHVQVPIFRKNKKWATVELRFAPIWADNLVSGIKDSFVGLILFVGIGSFICYFFVLKRSLRELDPSEVIPDRVQKAFDVLQEGILIIDNNEQIVLANNAIASIVGKPSKDLIGVKGSELGWLGYQNSKQIKQLPWIKLLQDGREQKGTALSLQNSLGDKIKLVVNATMITDNIGKSRGIMVTFADITKLEEKNFELSEMLEKVQMSHAEVKEKSKELEFLAEHDPLTMCLNRRAFNRKFNALFTSAKADGKELSCLMTDIDHFKKVNDTHGHAAGDQVIRAVTDVLKTCTRDHDLVGRYGGEEFCVVFPGQSLEIAAKVAERIRQKIEKEPCGGINITVSIGVSSITSNAGSAQELLDQADKTLYAAKKSGRNRSLCWGKTDPEIFSELTTKAENGDKDSKSDTSNVVPIDQVTLQRRVQELEGLLEKQSLEFEHNEMFDSKTGLPNRSLFEDRIGNEIARAKRNDTLVVVLSVSINTLKRIHDTLGYKVAEQLVKACAYRLNNILREKIDMVAVIDNINGMSSISLINQTEFGILLPDIKQVDHVTWLVKRMLDSFGDPFPINGNDIYMSAYFGISIFPNDGQTVEELYSSATNACSYAQKIKEKERYYFSSKSLNEKAGKQLQIENLLHNAIDNDELRLHYQPKIDAATGHIAGFEALIRWQSAQLGFVPPDAFIGIAEQNGLINNIGDWVLYTACRQLRTWLDMGLEVGSVAINMSGVQLRQDHLIDRIQNVLNEFNLESQLLEIELTESAFVDNSHKAITVLEQIKKMGIKVSMDDFGTGYSSLAYLRSIPLSCIKIDKSFIFDINKNENADKLIAVIISLAHTMELEVVAEGVEEKHQADYLISLGCEYLQGYYYSRPIPQGEVVELLHETENMDRIVHLSKKGG